MLSTAHPPQLTDSDLLTTVVLGLLIPVLLVRPSWLERSRLHVSRTRQRREEFLYSVFAIAGLTYAYLAVAEVFKKQIELTDAGENAVAGASTLLLLVVVSVHLVPLWTPASTRSRRVVVSAWALAGGVTLGSIYAANAFDPIPLAKTTPGSVITTVLTLGVIGVGAYFHGGISPVPSRRFRRGRGRLARSRRPVWK